MKIVRFVLMSIFLITACSMIAMKKGSQPNIAKITATAHKKVEAIAQAKTIEQLDKSANDAKSVFGQLRKLNQNEQVAQLENEMQEAMQKAKERFSQTPIQKSKFTTWVNKNKVLLGLLGVSIMSIMYPETTLPAVAALSVAAGYQKIGLTPDATPQEVKRACRKQRGIAHPDAPGGSHEAYLEIDELCDRLEGKDFSSPSYDDQQTTMRGHSFKDVSKKYEETFKAETKDKPSHKPIWPTSTRSQLKQFFQEIVKGDVEKLKKMQKKDPKLINEKAPNNVRAIEVAFSTKNANIILEVLDIAPTEIDLESPLSDGRIPGEHFKDLFRGYEPMWNLVFRRWGMIMNMQGKPF